jgi:alkylhydroperoxidase family enzyme
VSSQLGVSTAKIEAVEKYSVSELFDERERVALAYADAITLSDEDVDEALFERVEHHFSADAIIDLTAVIAWENASSKFNRALRIESQQLWRK